MTELPVGYSILGDIATVNPPKPKYDGLGDDEEVGFIPMAAVDELTGAVRVVERRSLGSLRDKSYRTFAPSDVLFAKITPCMENGKSAVVPDLPADQGFGSTEFHVIRSGADVIPEYIWRFVRQRSYRVEAEAHMTGSVGQLRVPPDFLRTTQLRVPPPQEQRQLVDLLDRVGALRSIAAARLRTAGELLNDFRRSVLAAACTGALTADWRSNHPNETAADIPSLGLVAKKRKRPAFESEIDLPEVPDSYQLALVSEVATAIEYGTSRKADGGPTDVAVVRMGNIQNGLLDLSDLKFMTTDDEVRRLQLCDGDLLFNRTNSPELVGKSAVWRRDMNATFASYLIRVQVHPEAAVPEFVNYWINSSWGRLWAHQVKTDGVSQSNINGTKLSEMLLPLPPLTEQREIVRRVESAIFVADHTLAQIESAERLLDCTDQSATAMAFRGELTV